MLIAARPAEGVLELRLDRPAQLNALTMALAQQLRDAVLQAAADPSVRVLLLGGEGRGFCAGKDRDDPATTEFVEVLQQLAAALMDCPKPVVAAVHGWAVGAGLELLLNCDIVLAAQSARFMLPEVHLGLFGTGGVVALLPRKIGLARAKAVLMLGREFSAAEAAQWGLVWSVVEDAQLRPQAVAIAQQLAAADAAVLAGIKALLHEETFGDLGSVLAREAQAHARLGLG